MGGAVSYLLKNPNISKLEDRYLTEDAFYETGNNKVERRRSKEIAQDIVESDSVRFQDKDIQVFLNQSLAKLGFKDKNVIINFNKFIDANLKDLSAAERKSLYLKADGSNFRPAHLAAIYVAVKSTPDGFKDMQPALEGMGRAANVNLLSVRGMFGSLKDRFGDRAADMGKDAAKGAGAKAIPNVPGVPSGAAGKVIDEFTKAGQDRKSSGASDTPVPKRGAPSATDGTEKTSTAIKRLEDSTVADKSLRRELKVFLKEALNGILKTQIPDGNENALIAKLNEVLKPLEFDPIHSLDEMTADRLASVFGKAADKALFKTGSAALRAWDDLREKLNLPEGLKLADRVLPEKPVFSHPLPAPAAP